MTRDREPAALQSTVQLINPKNDRNIRHNDTMSVFYSVLSIISVFYTPLISAYCITVLYCIVLTSPFGE